MVGNLYNLISIVRSPSSHSLHSCELILLCTAQGESQTENSQADSPRLDNDSNLDSLQLADSQLDNLIKCTLCNKPVLQASLGDHQGEYQSCLLTSRILAC